VLTPPALPSRVRARMWLHTAHAVSRTSAPSFPTSAPGLADVSSITHRRGDVRGRLQAKARLKYLLPTYLPYRLIRETVLHALGAEMWAPPRWRPNARKACTLG
jgi:hypothetical protein